MELTTDQIKERIAGINKQMQGSLSDIERRLLHEDRRDLREELRKREGGK